MENFYFVYQEFSKNILGSIHENLRIALKGHNLLSPILRSNGGLPDYF